VSQLAEPWSGSVVLITFGWSHLWQHAVKPYIGSESWFLPTAPAFEAPLGGGGGSHRNIAKKLEWFGYQMVKKVRRYEYSFWQNVRTWQTDGQTDKQTNRHICPYFSKTSQSNKRAIYILDKTEVLLLTYGTYLVGKTGCNALQPIQRGSKISRMNVKSTTHN